MALAAAAGYDGGPMAPAWGRGLLPFQEERHLRPSRGVPYDPTTTAKPCKGTIGALKRAGHRSDVEGVV
jgi:hypothetical protein